MGRFRYIAAAFALVLSSTAIGGAAAQDLEPLPAPTVEADAAVTDESAPAVTENMLSGMGTQPVAGVGQPSGGEDVQPQVTDLGQRASNFNHALLIIMSIVTIFVFSLLIWAIVRFRRKANPTPSKTTHNVLIEVLWTVVPVLILVGIAVPSFGLLLDQYDPPEADVTVKAIGHQWYWEYEYPDEGNFGFDAIMLSNEEAAAAGEPALLATDNRVVVPVGATVKMLITSVDVLHSWAMPAFWVKMDAVPGKINETWFNAKETGVFYGQCSELCGTKHGFMPIAVEVVEQDQYDAWVAARQADAGIDPADLVETAATASETMSEDVADAVATGGTVQDGLNEATTAAPAGTVIEEAATDSGVATTE